MSDDTPIEIKSDMGQFAMVPLWVIENASATAISVYALMGAKWANRTTKDCYPSYATMAKILKVNPRTIMRAVTELEDMKALTVMGRVDNAGRQSSNLYTLLVTPPDGLSQGGDSGVTLPPDSGVTPGVTLVSPEPEEEEPESVEPPPAPSSPRSSTTSDGDGMSTDESGMTTGLNNGAGLSHQDPIAPGSEDVVCSDLYGPSHSTRRHVVGSPEAIRLDGNPPADSVPATPLAPGIQVLSGELAPPDKLSWDQVMEAKDPELFAHIERLCNLLADLYHELGNKRPNPFQKAWYTSMRLLLTKDGANESGYTPGQVEAIIRWALADDFWQTNIRSAPTLRKQFDQLRGKRNAEIAKRKRTESTQDSEDTSWMARPSS